MNKSVSIYNALCLPAPDVDALIQGRIIAAIPRTLLDFGKTFALYPVEISTAEINKYYHPNFLPIAKTAWEKFHTPGILLQPEQLSLIPTQKQLQLPLSESKVLIKAWAKCELCQMPDQTKPLDILSQLTIWKPEKFKEILQKHPHFFLAYLRVYHLDKPDEISAIPNIQDKLGKFVSLPNISASEAKPVLNDQVFIQRKQQLENLEPPLHPELEELQTALSQIANNNPAAQELENEIKVFLGWSNAPIINIIDADLAWIKTIAALGDRSIELEEKKNNYQAGTDFENISRQSLEFLGFNVENAYKGGAGGLDLYCSQPYPLVCECKAGKSIPSGTVQELIKLGGMHLGTQQFINSAKLVIGPGNATSNTQKSAQQWKVSIIKAMTLQKLVELKAKYPGTINLIELKQYLEPGQIDDKINEYIAKIEKEIKLRSHIIQVLKNYLQLAKNERIGVEALHAVYITSNPPQNLEDRELYDILIELSSPLTGYLGRIKEDFWKKDRFYYLRDLPIN
ncbi:DUF1802 family protein [Dolichospermum planctonicum]|uniref:DUF1802 domain-containing protein n=1 Tax=Dolichospermum planctonicum TaxID=136072 RepID=A0A480AIE2_9CYAN|nr:DUF1802 family protein [Dolichospermum planctonicum]GCL44152.1 hypothetical protein NIES80_38780 [Dolichospermum planctonicum]